MNTIEIQARPGKIDEKSVVLVFLNDESHRFYIVKPATLKKVLPWWSEIFPLVATLNREDCELLVKGETEFITNSDLGKSIIKKVNFFDSGAKNYLPVEETELAPLKILVVEDKQIGVFVYKDGVEEAITRSLYHSTNLVDGFMVIGGFIYILVDFYEWPDVVREHPGLPKEQFGLK